MTGEPGGGQLICDVFVDRSRPGRLAGAASRESRSAPSRFSKARGPSSSPYAAGSWAGAGGGSTPQKTRAQSGPKTELTTDTESCSTRLSCSAPITSMPMSPSYSEISRSASSTLPVSLSNRADVTSTNLDAAKRRGGTPDPGGCRIPAYSWTAALICAGVSCW